jgi:uncharacterized protein (TIGR02246 family)
MLRLMLLFSLASLAFAQTSAIERILNDSEAAWNRGDLASFASYYDDSPETTFIGKEVVHGGVAAILARYRRAYPTRAAMGTLTFSEIQVRPLTDGFALANGKYALERTASAGGNTSGRFTLVLKLTASGWKIIHDHSSQTEP